jgi:hypothetical protein
MAEQAIRSSTNKLAAPHGSRQKPPRQVRTRPSAGQGGMQLRGGLVLQQDRHTQFECGNEKGATPSFKSVASELKRRNYNLLFPAFLALAHLALAAADIAALPAALIFRFGFGSGVADAVVPLIFAHLAS